MEKRLFVAAAASVVILLLWGYLFPPPQPPQHAVPETAGATAPVSPGEPPPQPAPTPAASAEAQPPKGERVQAEEEKRIQFQNDLFEVELTNRGAAVLSWKLRDYLAPDGTSVELFPHYVEEHPLPLSVELDDADLTTRLERALYRVERVHQSRQEGLAQGERITFNWSDGEGLEVRKSLTFRDGSYVVDSELEVTDHGRRLPARLVVGPGLSTAGAVHAGWSSYYYEGQAVWNIAGEVGRLKKSKVTREGNRVTGPIRWAGLEDQYFAMLVLPHAPESQLAWRAATLTPTTAAQEKQVEPQPEPVLAVSVPPEGASLFAGPKKYTLLRELGRDLDKVVWFSSTRFLAWISKSIFLGLLWIHDHTVHNYGVAIILATFVLRLVLFPVNQFAMVSMKKTQIQMQRLAPKINAIKNKYRKTKDADSRAKMNQEVMELYRREGVNPMGGVSGCLPLLAQFPILIGFYNMLTVAIELRGAHFLGWITDLSQKDPYWVVPLLMGVTMFVQQRMAMSKVKDPMQQQQQRIMMFMPFVFTYICTSMPSGMVLYWFVNNLLGIGQQWLVNRHTSRLEEAAAQKA